MYKVVLMVIIAIASFHIGISLILKGYKVFELKKYDLKLSDEMGLKLFIKYEKFMSNKRKEYKDGAIKHLIEVYDLIVVAHPDMELANQLLNKKCVITILDYYNSKEGRILKIKVEKTIDREGSILILNLNELEKEAYNSDGNKNNYLRIIK